MVKKRGAAQGESLFRANREGEPLAARMRPRDAGRVRGAGAGPGPGQAAARGDRARRARLHDLLGTAGEREDHARPPGRQLHRAGVRALQRSLRGCAADPRDRGRGTGQARRRCVADHPVRGRDPPAQQGAAGQPAAPHRGRHAHPDRRHHRESQLRDQRRAAVADPRVRAAAARRGARRASCCAGRSRTASGDSARSSSGSRPTRSRRSRSRPTATRGGRSP